MPQGKSRLSIWVPRNKRWVIHAIENVRSKADDRGIPLSESEVVLLALEEMLQKHIDKVPSKKVDADELDGCSLQRTVTCRRADQWLLERLDTIVDTKKSLGIKTSFSYELFRLAKNALAATLKGSKLDREIMEDSHADR
jgi:hypothetical protein